MALQWPQRVMWAMMGTVEVVRGAVMGMVEVVVEVEQALAMVTAGG